MTAGLKINLPRLIGRIRDLAEIGALPGGGCCRLALSDADKQGRDLVRSWMVELGLVVSIDRIGNIIGTRPGRENLPPVMVGSHIDTVATGGIYDGNLGVLAGLEVIECLNDAGFETRYPIAVGIFTNEEGARFTPDMMGSAVHQGSLPLAEALAAVDKDGLCLEVELARIGYAGEEIGDAACVHRFFELHIEQGPVLEEAGVEIGAVTGVQGISWTAYNIAGVSNHAGTTPMRLRKDAGLAAAEIAVAVRRIVTDIGGNQVGTVGALNLSPNLINVIAREAGVSVDLRNTDDAILKQAEARVSEAVEEIAMREGVTITAKPLVRFAPVDFDPAMVDLVEASARAAGRSVLRMPSGAGHDAQMFAPNCPTAMIFVPSKDGISHNVNEFTPDDQIEAGANVLLDVVRMEAGE